MRKYLALLLAVLMMAACFAGCKKKETAVSKETEPTEEVFRRTVVVGYVEREPMCYLKDGKPVGFDVELAKTLFGKLGYDVMFQEIQWEDKYNQLDNDAIDCVWCGFVIDQPEQDGTLPTDLAAFSYKYLRISQGEQTDFYAVAFKSGNPLRKKVNEQLEALAADGTIAKIAKKYDLSNNVITDFTNQK